MLDWIGENIGTILTVFVLLISVGGIVLKLHRDKKRGRSACGCSCGCCPMSDSCHKH